MFLQEAKNEYSHLDPARSPPVQLADNDGEDEEEDIYDDLGDLESTDLMQFAYQIATGMVNTVAWRGVCDVLSANYHRTCLRACRDSKVDR